MHKASDSEISMSLPKHCMKKRCLMGILCEIASTSELWVECQFSRCLR
nr:MAG TPA: hypothetical protein [Caudoviricetes sp.]